MKVSSVSPDLWDTITPQPAALDMLQLQQKTVLNWLVKAMTEITVQDMGLARIKYKVTITRLLYSYN